MSFPRRPKSLAFGRNQATDQPSAAQPNSLIVHHARSTVYPVQIANRRIPRRLPIECHAERAVAAAAPAPPGQQGQLIAAQPRPAPPSRCSALESVS